MTDKRVPTKTLCVTLPQPIVEFLTKLGFGRPSQGIQALISESGLYNEYIARSFSSPASPTQPSED